MASLAPKKAASGKRALERALQSLEAEAAQQQPLSWVRLLVGLRSWERSGTGAGNCNLTEAGYRVQLTLWHASGQARASNLDPELRQRIQQLVLQAAEVWGWTEQEVILRWYLEPCYKSAFLA